MKFKTPLLAPIIFSVFLCGILQAAPAVVTLTGHAYNGTAILWTWAAATDPSTTFTLLDESNSVVASLVGTSASSFIEGSLAANTAYSRRLVQADSVSTSTSSMVTVATPDASAVVPLGSAATVVGSDNLSRAALAAGALSAPGQISVSLDPVNKPLTGDTPALIAAADAKLAAAQTPVSASRREFSAISNGIPFTSNFASAATLQIPYSDANNTGYVDGLSPQVPVQTLSLYTLDPAAAQWIPVSGFTLDTVNKVVTANASHFSIYTLIGVAGPADLSTLKVYPNPWRPSSGGPFDDTRGVHFSGLPPLAEVKIYTIRGDIVRKFEKQVTDSPEWIWNGRNSDEEAVVSGIYFYLVSDRSSGRQIKDRLGIIR